MGILQLTTFQSLDRHGVCEGVLGPLPPNPCAAELPASQVASVHLTEAPTTQRLQIKHLGRVKGQTGKVYILPEIHLC